MRYLLDTHCLIWFLTNDSRLSENIKSQIKDPANQISISVASLWEIGIKHGLKKLDLQINLGSFFETVQSSSIEIKPILPQEILVLAQLLFHIATPLIDSSLPKHKSETILSFPRTKLFSLIR